MDDPFCLVGKTLDSKYVVDAMIASGGFSVVYRATHLLWKRPVAIKAFQAASGLTPMQRSELLEAFVREGALLGELSEKSVAVCQARDIGSTVAPSGDWVPYLVLEWLEGEALDIQLQAARDAGSPPSSLAVAIELLSPAVAALSLAHKDGICHLDLKPGNMFVLKSMDGRPSIKLIDFGVAKVVAHASKAAKGGTVGPQFCSFTPKYGAPEQFQPDLGPTGPWTDVFALALVLCELITGREALAGIAPEAMARAAVDPDVRPTPRTCGANVSDDIERVFLRALDVDPMKRFATAGDFWKALELAAGDELMEPFLLRRASEGSLDVPNDENADVESCPPSRPRLRRSRVVSLAAAVMVLGAATIEAPSVAKRLGLQVPVEASSMMRDIAEFVRSR